MLKESNQEEAKQLLKEGYKCYHSSAPEGECYIMAKSLPYVRQSWVVSILPSKFVYSPKIYHSKDWYRGCFWWKDVQS